LRDRSEDSESAPLWGRVLPALRRPGASLRSRIILSVFAASFVTTLTVAGVSTHATEAFLRAKIDQKFPDMLRATSERMDLWYSQRRLDVETFARSAVLIESLARLDGSPGSRRSRVAREELEKYLSYVLERFPQYRALFLLDLEGRPILWVGHPVALPDSTARHLSQVSEAGVGSLFRVGGQRVQVASSPVRERRNEPLATLHALVVLEALEEVLQSEGLGDGGGIYVVGADARTLMQSPGSAPRERHSRPLPLSHVPPRVEDYANEAGVSVVGSALRFDRFGWSIIVEEPYEQAFAPVVTVIRRTLAINLAIVLILGAVAYQFARSIARPIQALSRAAARIASGEMEVEIPEPTSQDEIGVLATVFRDMMARLGTNTQQLQRANEQLEQLSITDDLTRLHNHRYFQDQLPREIRRSERTGEPLALILIDIDDFKKLNDRFGHAVGDAVLRRISQIMNEAVRQTDLLARYGGEEFALLAGHTDVEGARALAEKVRVAVRDRPISVVDLDGPSELPITVSVGVAMYRGDEKALFNDADRALYDAKAAGKDCVIVAE
jgi:diguanylate cyclase (GGDEF)-like protein